MDHLTLFTTTQEYKDAKDNLLIPNVSYIQETDSVEYMTKHVIDFGTDNTSKSMCVSRWDTDGDGEISFEEAAAVRDISTIFDYASIVDGMWLRYFKGLSYLNTEAFRYAASLTKLAVPKNIQQVGNNWIGNANALRELYFYWTTIPAYSKLSTVMVRPSVEKVYIPKGTYNTYAAHTRFAAHAAKLVELEKMP